MDSTIPTAGSLRNLQSNTNNRKLFYKELSDHIIGRIENQIHKIMIKNINSEDGDKRTSVEDHVYDNLPHTVKTLIKDHFNNQGYQVIFTKDDDNESVCRVTW